MSSFRNNIKIIGLCLYLLGIALGTTWLVDRYYREYANLTYDYPQNILLHPKIDPGYDLVKLGNSHAQDGITFDAYSVQALDLSGVAQKFETDFALLKQHQRQINPGAVILIPITPISFSHTKPKNEKGFQALYYGRVSPLLIPNLYLGEYIEQELFPFIRAGYNFRRYYQHQLREKIARQEKGLDPDSALIVETSQSSSVDTDRKFLNEDEIVTYLATSSAVQDQPNALEYSDNVHFTYTKWLETDEFRKSSFVKNRHDLESILELSYEQGWKPVLVMIPITADLNRALPQGYMDEYLYSQLDQLKYQDVPRIDFIIDQRLAENKSLFSNSDHFNKYGARIYSYLLLQELIKLGLVSNDLDGYLQ